MKIQTQHIASLPLRQAFCFTALLLLQGVLFGCSGGSASNLNETVNEPAAAIFSEQPPETNIAVPDNRFSSDYSILIFGNSHTTGIAPLIEQILRADNQNIAIHIESAGGGFLDNSATNPGRLERLQSRSWSHVILQGQKYSQSGAVTYPTVATQHWISEAKRQNATPILFPEHPQRGNPTEGQQVHDLHTSISAVQAACVAPVGLVWDRVIALRPDLTLHLSDGNHASALGQVLTAMVFFEVITGYQADLLPYIPELDASLEVQDLFGQIVSEIIAEHTPCDY